LQHCKQQVPGPLDDPIWSGLWPLTKKAKCPLATPTPQHLVLLQLAGATASSGSAEDLHRAAYLLTPPAYQRDRTCRSSSSPH